MRFFRAHRPTPGAVAILTCKDGALIHEGDQTAKWIARAEHPPARLPNEMERPLILPEIEV